MAKRKGRAEVAAVRTELRRTDAVAVPPDAKVDWSEHRRDLYDVEAVHETWAQIVRCTHGHIVSRTDHAGTQTASRCESGGTPNFAYATGSGRRRTVPCRKQ